MRKAHARPYLSAFMFLLADLGREGRVMDATKTTKTGSSAQGCQTVDPQAIPPTAAELAKFEELDRAALRRLFTEPAEYVDHELFYKADAEKIVFGSEPRLEPGAIYFDDDEAIDPALSVLEEGTTLTAAAEIALFQRFNFARKRIAQILDANHGRKLSLDKLRELLAWHHRANLMRDEITKVNMPLVLAMAKRTRLNGLDPNEMVSEGNFALLRSIDKFDCSRGYKFSTYACRAIIKSFSRVAMRTSRYRGRFPTEFDPTLEKSDYVERKRDGVEAECVDEIRDIMDNNRASLNEVEQRVIRERFALDSPAEEPKGKTLEQVGEMIGVTKERVRQIQNKALKKIRLILEDNFLAASN